MSKLYKHISGFMVATVFVLPQTATAQNTLVEQPVDIISSTPLKKNNIIRKVEPVPYWVESDQLRIRDTPFQGDVIGMLELGQKIKAYDQFENWVRISKSSSNAKWVNTNFLTNTPITWARYSNHATRNQRRVAARGDTTLTRIKVEGNKSTRIYAASVKESANGNRVIVTRQNFRSGPYFEKRLVACENKAATHVQILGEGYTYIMMEKDIRALAIDIDTDKPKLQVTASERLSPATIAVANFSCETDI